MKGPKEFAVLEQMIRSTDETKIVLSKIYVPYKIFHEMIAAKDKLPKIVKTWKMELMYHTMWKDYKSATPIGFNLWATDVFPHWDDNKVMAHYSGAGIREYSIENKKLVFTAGYINPNNYINVDFGIFGRSGEQDRDAEIHLREFIPPFQRYCELEELNRRGDK